MNWFFSVVFGNGSKMPIEKIPRDPWQGTVSGGAST